MQSMVNKLSDGILGLTLFIISKLSQPAGPSPDRRLGVVSRVTCPC